MLLLFKSFLERTVFSFLFKKLLFGYLIANQSCGISRQVTSGNDRIIGGRVALDGEFPWQVSIARYSSIEADFVHICGGSIISNQWILTAAHCVYGVPENNFKIVANITKLSEASDYHLVHNVSKIIIHSDFDEEKNLNDIALIKLTEPLDLSEANGHMGTICLPRTSSDEPSLQRLDQGVFNFVTVTGWGTTYEEGDNSINLLAADVALVETDKCNATYEGKLAEGFICAGLVEGGRDSCQGDSGGPMIYRDSHRRAHLIGIVSWGEGCGRASIPGVYVDVKHYLLWISKYVSI